VYLGKAEKLTPEKLNDAAAVLARSDDDVTASSATEVATDGAETVPTNEAATVSPVAPDDHTRERPHHSISDPSIVLTPKLRAPTPRPEQLVRPRLLELLGEALHRKATLISAPAGYGKTTLLAQWRRAQETGLPFAWVSLDEQDNDPVRLWRHIVEALRRVAPEEDFGADDLVEMSAAGQKLLEIVLPTLINGLAELPLSMVVVLDDYQVITEGECQPDDELTKRELDVLRLFDSELSTQQIAQRLYVAPSTVRTYIKSINRKLGVSSRKEAVKQAHTSGLL
jgi:ATP/maltotriose-dependent transcriptional regulator MalT